MQTETFKGTVESAYGNTLPEAIKFSGSYEKYESMAEAKTANDVLSDEEQLTVINNKRKANARAKATTAALEVAGISKPTLEDPQVQLKQMIKILVMSGKSESDAQKFAESALGVTLEK